MPPEFISCGFFLLFPALKVITKLSIHFFLSRSLQFEDKSLIVIKKLNKDGLLSGRSISPLLSKFVFKYSRLMCGLKIDP